MEDTTTDAQTAGQQTYSELNDMTPQEVYEAAKAGQFNVSKGDE